MKKTALVLSVLLLTNTARAASEPVDAAPKADFVYSELFALRATSPSAFEAAFNYNKARLLKCGDILTLQQLSGEEAFTALNEYFIQTNAQYTDEFKAVFEQSEAQIKCHAEVASINREDAQALFKLNRLMFDISAEYSARHGVEGFNADVLDTIALSKSDMTIAEIKDRIEVLMSTL